MHTVKILALVLTLALVVLGGTVFFHWAEGWSWLDAYFVTVVTLSTVGYGSLVPAPLQHWTRSARQSSFSLASASLR